MDPALTHDPHVPAICFWSVVEVAVVELLYKVARVRGWPSEFSGLSLKLDVLKKPLLELDSKFARP